MLISIGKNTFVNPDEVSAVEQVDGNLWVWVDGKAFLADSDMTNDVFEKIINRETTVPDKWEGR